MFLAHPYLSPFKNNGTASLKNHFKACFKKKKRDDDDDIRKAIRRVNDFLLLFLMKMLMINRFLKKPYAIMISSWLQINLILTDY